MQKYRSRALFGQVTPCTLSAIRYEPVMGLEVHAQVQTKSKMFCGCPSDVFGKPPNSFTCPVCLGLPGALPVANRVAIEKTVTLAQALGCKIAEFSQFERKNYFYPDLPKGFQISQYAFPVGEGGIFEGVAIRRVHLEEDTARLIHEGGGSLADFNRSGIPLIEVVTEPVLSDLAKVSEFLKELRLLLIHLEISTADMEKGSLRLEANLSLRKAGGKGLPPYKVELKNINSFVFLERALRAEISRQEELLRGGQTIPQETRGYDQKRGVTFLQRKKEEAFDYRYFPEPDLPPLTKAILIGEEVIVTLEEMRRNYVSLGVPSQYVELLVRNRNLADLFEELRREIPPVETANILVNQRFGDPLELGKEKILSFYREAQSKELLSGEKLEPYIEKVLLDNPAAVSDYLEGRESALQFLLGQLMRETGGRIAPQERREVLKKRIHARAQTSAKN